MNLEANVGSHRFDIRIDVKNVIDSKSEFNTAAWIYTPSFGINPGKATVIFSFPGGTYTRAYYDLHVPGRTNYSFAEYVTETGHIVVACDHIGIGDSTPYEQHSALTNDHVVRADQATVQGILSRLAEGSITDHIPPITNPFTIGVGHSWGGIWLILQQARYRTFDAVAILGHASCDALAKEQKKKFVKTRKAYKAAHRDRNIKERKEIIDSLTIRREKLHNFFHDESVPTDVIAADDELATRIYTFIADPEWHLSCRLEADKAAQELECPVFLGFGEFEGGKNVLRQAAIYSASYDVTTFIVPNAAHCFNFAANRQLFYERISAWSRDVSQTYRHQSASSTGLRRGA